MQSTDGLLLRRALLEVSTTDIQRHWRGHRLRQAMLEEDNEYWGACRIQAAARGWLVRAPIAAALAELDAQEIAEQENYYATQIQARWRGGVDRRAVWELEEAQLQEEEEAAAVVIQEHWMERLLRARYRQEIQREEEQQIQREDAAVVKLQVNQSAFESCMTDVYLHI